MKGAVLFVDDNQMLCRLTCDILRTEGYHAVAAFDGQEALGALQREPFDIVVTDYVMEGMDGLQLARAIHDLDPKVPIILVTGYEVVQAEDIRASLPKGEMFPGLLETIESCLAETTVCRAG